VDDISRANSDLMCLNGTFIENTIYLEPRSTQEGWMKVNCDGALSIAGQRAACVGFISDN